MHTVFSGIKALIFQKVFLNKSAGDVMSDQVDYRGTKLLASSNNSGTLGFFKRVPLSNTELGQP
jgi:hypothetical protein